MSKNSYLKKIISLPDKTREIFIEQVNEFTKWIENHADDENKAESFPYECVEKIVFILHKDENSYKARWKQIGHLNFLKNGNRFTVIETMRFGDNYIGAVYEFDLQTEENMMDYIKIAEDSDNDFPNDLYKLAYGKAETLQLEQAISLKLSTNVNDLFIWLETWKLIAKDIT